MRRISLFWLFFWSTLGIAILLGLGTWQLFRLAEKRTYLAELDQRLTDEAVPLRQALQRSQAGEDVEFLKVTATGKLSPVNLYKQATFEGGPGWQVVTLFNSDDGIAVLVDRGVIADVMKDKLAPLNSQPVTMTGVVRRRDQGQGFFDPENDPAAGTWYWWDLPAMLGTQGIEAGVQVAPFILQALPQPGAALLPQPEDISVAIPNNHLGYAFTWFSLALCLAVIAGLLARREFTRRQT